MDYDAAAIRIAVKDVEHFKEIIDLGLNDELFVQEKAKTSWNFIKDYYKEYSELPPVQLVKEKFGYSFDVFKEERDLTVQAVMDKLFERYRYLFLRKGLEESVVFFEGEKFKDCENRIILLSDQLKEERIRKAGIKTLAHVIPEAQELYERTKRGEVGIPFPWELMTGVTMGLWPGTVTFFVARPGIGKTWTILKIAWNAFRKHDKKVLVVSPEMTSEEFGERLVACEGGFNFTNMVEAKLGTFGEKKLYQTYEEMKSMEGFYLLEDEDMMNPQGIEDAIDEVDPDLICVDSVYMLRVEAGAVKKGPGSKGGRQERMVDTIEWLRRMAKKRRKALVGVSQLSRDAKLKKGSVEYIKKGKGTGGLENTVALSDTLFWSSNNLFALFQDDDMKESKRLMYIPLKARRQAKWSAIVTRWDLELMDFEEEGTFYKSNYDDEFKDEDYDLVY